MNLTKTTFLVAAIFTTLLSFAQLNSSMSYSTTACNGKIFMQNSAAYPNWEWYTADTLTSLGVNTDTVYNLCPGTYLCNFQNGANWMWASVDVYDRDSCRQFPPMLNWSVPTDTQTCDGMIEVNTSTLFAALPPYSFQWNTGATVQTLDNLCMGTYWVIVTDGFGCVDSLGSYIYPWCAGVSGGVLNYTIPSGYYNYDGELSHYISGMTPPYTKIIEKLDIFNPAIMDSTWTINSSSDTLFMDSLGAGFYNIKVIDADGCYYQNGLDMYDTLLYNGCNNFQLYANTTNVTTSTSCDGTAEVFASGNDGTVSYHWLDINGDTISNDIYVDSLCAGNYIVHAYDQNNCYLNYVVLVGDSNGIQIDYTILTEASSPSTCDGEIIFQISGGTPPYTTYHAVSGDSNVLVQQNMCPGIYRIDVWDATPSYQGLNYLIVPPNQLFNGLGGNTPLDTLNGLPVERCDVDYDDIQNAYIINYTIVDSLISTNWVVNYNSGGSTIIQQDYIGNIDTSQTYAFTLSIFCSQLKALQKRFKAYSDLSGAVLELKENEIIDISVYPNPSNGTFNISTPKEGVYQLFQANGALISQGTLEEGLQTITTKATGILIFRFKTNRGVITKRLIVN